MILNENKNVAKRQQVTKLPYTILHNLPMMWRIYMRNSLQTCNRVTRKVYVILRNMKNLCLLCTLFVEEGLMV